jgi:uncharacterized protein (DUF2062 family)
MAIFRRRKKREFSQSFRESVWPTQGWRRTISYYWHRLFRTGDSTYKITAGLASGVAVSWTPFLGTHFLQAMCLSWLLRANVLASFVGTIWGNPWTFYFIFMFTYKLGVWICGLFGLDAYGGLPPYLDYAYFMDAPLDFIKAMLAHPMQLLLPLVIGGYLSALLVWPLSYALLYWPVRLLRRAYRVQRIRRFKRKMRKKK